MSSRGIHRWWPACRSNRSSRQANLSGSSKILVNLEFVRNGGNHNIYRSPSGKTIPIPRHPRDLERGLLLKILREVGLDLSLQEFMEA